MPIYVALGANQNSVFKGKPRSPIETFRAVFDELTRLGIKVTKISSVWESPAWPDPDAQPAYNNAVIEIESIENPVGLLQLLKELEHAFGRREGQRNAARPLDLDILDYNGQTLNQERLSFHTQECVTAHSSYFRSWKSHLIGRTQ